MLVLATTMEAERAFSTGCVVCMNLRSQLANDLIDTLLFLRSY